MSKRAEKAAQKIFRPIDKGVVNLVTKQELIDFQNLRMEQKRQYIAGYEQAEQDLALTWEDMAKIDAIILDVNNEFAVDYSKEISRQKFYEEVLKRFNEIRKK